METNSPADEQTPAPSPEPPAENSADAVAEEDSFGTGEPAAADTPADVDTDELAQLAEASQRARLAPADEERMGALLKEALLDGRAGVARAIDVLPKVPWIVGVRAVETVWPELTAGFRTQLLAGLGKDDSDAARRIRLSLARALFKIDEPVALKLAAGVTRELRDEAGLLTPKQAQIFANVFIGRGKPWLAQMPLGDLKPADVDSLVHCAVLAVFTLPHPPVTQLGVLKWAQQQGRLTKLHEGTLEVVKNGVARWSAKWQSALRKEVAELPEEITAVFLKPAPGEPRTPRDAEAEDEAVAENLPDDGISSAADTTEDEDEEEDESDHDDEDESDEEGAPVVKERPVYEPRPPRSPQDSESRGRESQRERPVYTPRNAGAAGARNFNLSEALRQIDAHVQSLRNELAAAQAKSRQKERRPEKSGPIIAGEPTPEELARLNQQLEARNVELQARINDLAQHSEDVATSMGVMSDQPVSDTGAQLRALLALKLQEDFADFHALEKETNDLVVQEHYKGLLRHVFEVLQQLDVPLEGGAPATP